LLLVLVGLLLLLLQLVPAASSTCNMVLLLERPLLLVLRQQDCSWQLLEGETVPCTVLWQAIALLLLLLVLVLLVLLSVVDLPVGPNMWVLSWRWWMQVVAVLIHVVTGMHV
jgi:hypothetical protein